MMASDNKKWQVKHISDEQVKEACEMSRKYTSDTEPYLCFTLNCLVKITGAPEKVCFAKLGQCADRGLVNYGVSLRTCWWEGD